MHRWSNGYIRFYCMPQKTTAFHVRNEFISYAREPSIRVRKPVTLVTVRQSRPVHFIFLKSHEMFIKSKCIYLKMIESEIHKIIQEREEEIIEQASHLAKEVARKELALLEFELFHQVMVTKKSKLKAEKSVQKLRQEKWKKALQQANGDEEDALLKYDAF